MKLISTKNFLAVCVALGFSVSANAATEATSELKLPVAPVVVEPTVPAATLEAVKVEQGDVKTEDKEVKKEKKLNYAVTKSTLYNQLSYDFGKKGYKVVWELSFDPSFEKGDYKSIEDQMVYSLNRLNQVWGGNFSDGNKVQGLICPQKKEVYFTFSNRASGVVDKDGLSCNLITPLNTNLDSNGNPLRQQQQATGANYYETGNILSGPMIVGH